MLLPYRRLYRLIEGRASRREYWMFTLLVVIVAIVGLALVAGVAGASALSIGQDVNPVAYGGLLAGAGAGAVVLMIAFYIWLLLTGVASLGVTIRRIHDLNYSGWFLLLYYVVLIIGALISKYLYLLFALGWIVAMCLPGTKGSNKYGNDPTTPDLDVEAFA